MLTEGERKLIFVNQNELAYRQLRHVAVKRTEFNLFSCFNLDSNVIKLIFLRFKLLSKRKCLFRSLQGFET